MLIYLMLGVAVLGAFAFSMATLVLAIRLKKFRVDIDADQPFTQGASRWSWQLNVYRRRNYRPEASRGLFWLYACAVGQLVSAITAVVLFAIAAS